MSNKNKFRDAVLALEKEFWEAFNKESQECAANNPNWWGGCDDALEEEMREEWGFPYSWSSEIRDDKEREEAKQLAERAAKVGVSLEVYSGTNYSLDWNDGALLSPSLKVVEARLQVIEKRRGEQDEGPA